jgi:hypothetical protein
VPSVNEDSLAEKTDGLPPFTKADTLLSRAPQFVPETTHKNFRIQRFENALNFLSTQISQIRPKGHSPQVRSSTWLYLFDLATCPEHLERVSSQFSRFVENGRRFRDEHVNAFVRTWFEGGTSLHSNLFATGRCVELRCPELALNVFSNRSAYRVDLTLPGARHLLYALYEERQFSNIVVLVALFPLYNIPALTSDPISCALLLSACLREANSSGSEPALTIAETFLSPFKQLLSQTPPMPIPADANRFPERRWMKDAMLSILDSLVAQGHEAGWIRDWCYQSDYGLPSNTR